MLEEGLGARLHLYDFLVLTIDCPSFPVADFGLVEDLFKVGAKVTLTHSQIERAQNKWAKPFTDWFCFRNLNSRIL